MKTFIINDLFTGESYKLNSETYEEAYLKICKYILSSKSESNLEEFKKLFSNLDCEVECLDDVGELVI